MKAAGISDGCLLASEVINHMDKNRPFVDFSDGRNAGTGYSKVTRCYITLPKWQALQSWKLTSTLVVCSLYFDTNLHSQLAFLINSFGTSIVESCLIHWFSWFPVCFRRLRRQDVALWWTLMICRAGALRHTELDILFGLETVMKFCLQARWVEQSRDFRSKVQQILQNRKAIGYTSILRQKKHDTHDSYSVQWHMELHDLLTQLLILKCWNIEEQWNPQV